MQRLERTVNADKLYQQCVKKHLLILREVAEMQRCLEYIHSVEADIASKKRK